MIANTQKIIIIYFGFEIEEKYASNPEEKYHSFLRFVPYFSALEHNFHALNSVSNRFFYLLQIFC